MARPRNEQLKRQIAQAAARQFREAGYNATSYSSIAAECGISRNLVQYHWPKKELLAMDFMDATLDESIAELGLSKETVTGDFESITAVGVRFFETLLKTAGSTQFLQDILASRDLTEGMLIFNLNWALGHVNAPDDIDLDAVRRNVITHMGGFYDLLYWCLRHDEPLDIEAELSKVVAAFARAMGA